MPNPGGENPLYITFPSSQIPHEHPCKKCSLQAGDEELTHNSLCFGDGSLCGPEAVYPFCVNCLPKISAKVKVVFSWYSDKGDFSSYPRVKYLAQVGVCFNCGTTSLNAYNPGGSIKNCSYCNTLHVKADGFWLPVTPGGGKVPKKCGCNGCSGQTS